MIKQSKVWSLLGILLSAFLSSCGGGGGGSSSGVSTTPTPVDFQPVAYTGSSTPASISNDNASELVGTIFGSQGSNTTLSIQSAGNSRAGENERAVQSPLLDSLESISRSLIITVSSLTTGNQTLKPAAVPPATVIEPCGPGTVEITGELDASNEGVVGLVFSQCDIDGELFTGKVRLTINNYGTVPGASLGELLEIDFLNIKSASGDISLSGTFHIVSLNGNGVYGTLTLDLVSLDNNTGIYFKTENFVVVSEPWVALGAKESISGRIYISKYGFVDIVTTSQLTYSSTNLDFPDLGGLLTITGANGSSVTLQSVDSGLARITVDTDGDGNADFNNGFSPTAFSNTPPLSQPPVADAGSDILGSSARNLVLDATNSFDSNADILAYSWRVASGPNGHTAQLTDPTSPRPVFSTNQPGKYQIELVASDGTNSVSDTLAISIRASTRNALTAQLGFRLIDAEYSAQLERVVMISADPNLLHIYDPGLMTDSTVPLPYTPTSVSVSPDGQFAAVGHDRFMSHIDLAQAQVIVTYPVSTYVSDIVLAGNGYAYAVPDFRDYIRSIELATGNETLQTGQIITANSPTRLHPDGDRLYLADSSDISPADLHNVSITGGTAAYSYNSPYHGDFPMCWNFWNSEDGSKIYTRCGSTFSATQQQATDLIFGGEIPVSAAIASLTHSSEAAQIALVPEPVVPTTGSGLEDTSIQFYDDQFYNPLQTLDIPLYATDTADYANHGRFVFFNSNGTKLYVISQADENSGALNDFSIVSYSGAPWSLDTKSTPDNSAPTARAGADQSTTTGIRITLDGRGSYDNDNDNLTYQWQMIAGPGSSAAVITGRGDGSANLVPDISGTYTLELTVSDGALTDTDTVSVSVDPAFNILGFQVIDAEYSDALERIIAVSDNPPTLQIINPATGAAQQVALPTAPTSVSVSPDGLSAVVGHNGWISHVDLGGITLLNTFAISTVASDIVHGGNGYAYVFPAVGSANVNVHSVDLAIGTETTDAGKTTVTNTKGKLRPGYEAIYAARGDVIPQDIEKYSIANGVAKQLFRYYNANKGTCGNLWISENGNRLFGRCGDVFHASSAKTLDQRLNGSLKTITNRDIDSLYHSAEAEKVLVLAASAAGQINFYNDEFLGFEGHITLPGFSANGIKFNSQGRFVFYNSNGSEFYAIVQADPLSGLTNDFAVVTYGK